MKTERLAASCCCLTTCKPIRGLKTVNSNGFRLNFFALFKICWVYVECLGMFQTSRFSCAERIKTIDNQLKCLRIIYCF
jgi:hypothetical protein